MKLLCGSSRSCSAILVIVFCSSVNVLRYWSLCFHSFPVFLSVLCCQRMCSKNCGFCGGGKCMICILAIKCVVVKPFSCGNEQLMVFLCLLLLLCHATFTWIPNCETRDQLHPASEISSYSDCSLWIFIFSGFFYGGNFSTIFCQFHPRFITIWYPGYYNSASILKAYINKYLSVW